MPEIVAEYDRQSPRSYLYFGFTAVVDLNVVDRSRLDRLKAADPGPAIVDCGNALVLANGYPMVYRPPATRFDAYPNFLYDPAQKDTIPKKFDPADHSPDAAVGRVAAGGGRCVKAHYEPGFDPAVGKLPVPTVSMMTEVREASHRRKLPFLLHANSVDAHHFAAEVKPDAVVHGMWNWGQENASAAELPARVREVLDAERQAGVAMMPTTRVIGGLADLFVPTFLDDPQLMHVLPARTLAWYRTKDGQSFTREITEGASGPALERGYRTLSGVQARALRAAVYFSQGGGRILFGSDTPSAPTFANPPGYNGFLELRALGGCRHLAEAAPCRSDDRERTFLRDVGLRDNRAGQDGESARVAKRSSCLNRGVRRHRDGHRERPSDPARNVVRDLPLTGVVRGCAAAHLLT